MYFIVVREPSYKNRQQDPVDLRLCNGVLMLLIVFPRAYNAPTAWHFKMAAPTHNGAGKRNCWNITFSLIHPLFVYCSRLY